jgi:hypothetical protein
MRLEFFIGRWTLPQKHLRSAKLLTRIANRPRASIAFQPDGCGLERTRVGMRVIEGYGRVK